MPGGESALDLSRLTELEQSLGTELEAIAQTLVTELSSALTRIAAGLEDGHLDEVAAAAHAARNSALMIDARPMLRELSQVETCARRNEPEAASDAEVRLRALWPRVQRELERAAAGGH